jgi:membrane fusion protein, multidrug efflux system
MKRIIIFSTLVILLAACGQKDSAEARQTKIDNLNKRIRQLETKKHELVLASDTIQAEKVFPVRVKQLTTDTIVRKIKLTANLSPWEEVYMAPASPGRIEKVMVKTGDMVRAGELLVKMDETQLNQAKIQLAQLEVDFERMKTLKESNSISAQQYEQMKMQVEVTRNNVKFLSDNTRLTAPFSGVITGKFFENGELYSGAPNTQAGKAAIVILQQIDPLKAIINISEKYYNEIKAGLDIEIIPEIYAGEVFKGKVDRKYPTIDPLTRSFKVEVKISNTSRKLRPGLFSRVELPMGRSETLFAPASAIIQQEGTNNRYIFIHRDGIAKRIDVMLGERFDDNIEIISDHIKAGDELIVAGQAVLMDNNKVNVTR